MGALEHTRITPYGVNRDLTPYRVGPAAWSEANGVVFRKNRTERSDAFQVHDVQITRVPERIAYRNYNNQHQWLYGGPAGLGMSAGGQGYEISPPGWTQVSPGLGVWTSLNSVPVYNHPERAPIYHGGNPTVLSAVLPGWPAGWTCAVMRGFKYYLMALDVTDGTGRFENEVRWSAAADAGNVPNEWTPSATNDAGSLSLSGTPGAIRDAVPLGDELLVYKPSSTYGLRWIGGIWILRQRKVFTSLGILGLKCAAEWQGKHFLVGDGDIVVHDGVTVWPVADKAVRRAIFDDLDSTLYASRSFVYHDKANRQMVFYWPSGATKGWCNRRAAYTYDDQVWTVEEVPQYEVSDAATGKYDFSVQGNTWAEPAGVTWAEDHGLWSEGTIRAGTDEVMVAWPDYPQLGERLRYGAPNSGQVQSSMTLLAQDLGRPDRTKMIDRLWLEGGASDRLAWHVQVGSSDAPSAPIIWGPEQTVEMNGDLPVAVGALIKGRYMSVKLRVNTSQYWYLDGMTVDHRTQGRY